MVMITKGNIFVQRPTNSLNVLKIVEILQYFNTVRLECVGQMMIRTNLILWGVNVQWIFDGACVQHTTISHQMNSSRD